MGYTVKYGPVFGFSFSKCEAAPPGHKTAAQRDRKTAAGLSGKPFDLLHIEDRLFQESDQRLTESIQREGGAFSKMTLLLLQGRRSGLAPIFGRVGDEFQSVRIFNSKVLAFREASQSVGNRSVFAIDIDAVDHVDRVVPRLIRLREINPLLAVMIMSERFSRDDMSAERQAIADGSLKLPANAECILRAIGVATQNSLRRQGF